MMNYYHWWRWAIAQRMEAGKKEEVSWINVEDEKGNDVFDRFHMLKDEKSFQKGLLVLEQWT